MERNGKGQFVRGNRASVKGGLARARALPAARRSEIARRGWEAMVARHFGGDEAAAKRWWGCIGAWASDVMAGYAGTWMAVFQHPGTPREFLQRFYAENVALHDALAFGLDDVLEMEF